MAVDDAAHVLAEARPAWDAIGASKQFHKWAHHVRSSQAFAVNLFAPLSPDAVARLLESTFATEMINAEPPAFEFSDPLDELAESASPHRHRTQVDVLVAGQSVEGPVALLVEVKLAETDFGWCSAATSPNNDRTDICARPGPFGDDPAGCFQLRNFNGATRRRYDEFVKPAPSLSAPGCWFRRSASQPMRNVALAGVLRRRHGGRVAVALCAPAEHRGIWTRWDAVRPAFDDALVDLPAEHVLALHADAVANALRDVYWLGAARDGRVVADLEWQTWSILASLVERYETPPIVVELRPGGGTYNCISLAAAGGWRGPTVDLNRGGGMHAHHSGGGLATVRDGWRRAARWGCDEVADEVARAAGFDVRREPVASVLRDFAADVAVELRQRRRVNWVNGMLDTSGYGGGVRTRLFESFPDLTVPREPGDDGFDAEVYRHWFLVTNGEPPLKHRYLQRASPVAHASA